MTISRIDRGWRHHRVRRSTDEFPTVFRPNRFYTPGPATSAERAQYLNKQRLQAQTQDDGTFEESPRRPCGSVLSLACSAKKDKGGRGPEINSDM